MTDITSVDRSSSTFFDGSKRKTSTGLEKETDYLLLLLEQLKNQDPSTPMSNTEMMGQMAQLTTIQELKNLAKTLEGFGQSTLIGSAASLVGMYATAQKDDESPIVEGVIEEVEITEGSKVNIIIDGQSMPMNTIQKIGF